MSRKLQYINSTGQMNFNEIFLFKTFYPTLLFNTNFVIQPNFSPKNCGKCVHLKGAKIFIIILNSVTYLNINKSSKQCERTGQKEHFQLFPFFYSEILYFKRKRREIIVNKIQIKCVLCGFKSHVPQIKKENIVSFDPREISSDIKVKISVN